MNNSGLIRFQNVVERNVLFIAIARKILVAAYHMLLTGEIWNPADLAEVETTVEQRIKYVKNNFKSDIKQLLNIGLTVEELTLMIDKMPIL